MRLRIYCVDGDIGPGGIDLTVTATGLERIVDECGMSRQ